MPNMRHRSNKLRHRKIVYIAVSGSLFLASLGVYTGSPSPHFPLRSAFFFYSAALATDVLRTYLSLGFSTRYLRCIIIECSSVYMDLCWARSFSGGVKIKIFL
jgi:hypothetical membrane protein